MSLFLMSAFDWKPMMQIDPEDIRDAKSILHQAIQNVASIGRKFLDPQPPEFNSRMVWVPALTRMAGGWIPAETTFRSSLSLESFEIFIVDRKVHTLASFPLEGKNYSQLMIWLEEQIGKFGLDASNLTLNLPYKIPDHPVQQGEPFHIKSKRGLSEFSKFYHNTYIALRKIKERYENAEIYIWPNRFDISMEITLKDTGDHDTNTRIAFGMSPGDKIFHNPYFFVSTWPNIDTEKCSKLSNNAIWMSEDWTGSVLLSKHIYEGDQQAKLEQFYNESGEQLIKLLLE